MQCVKICLGFGGSLSGGCTYLGFEVVVLVLGSGRSSMGGSHCGDVKGDGDVDVDVNGDLGVDDDHGNLEGGI